MASITYSKVSASYAPWQTTYDATTTVAKAFLPGWVGYTAFNSDGTSLIVKAHGGLIVSVDWVDWGLQDPVLMHADIAMDPQAFLDAIYGFRPSTAKAIAALLAGNDDITGGARKDNLIGGSGDDMIHAGSGNDRVNGGTGNDTIDGGPGADRMTGGPGADVFTFGVDAGKSDVITDFTPGLDRIDLSPTGAPLAFGENVVFDPATQHLRVDLDAVPGAELDVQLLGVTFLTSSDLILV